ncbi:hypothetical protein ACEPAF_1124 [Sanghuangporus sanghuang]
MSSHRVWCLLIGHEKKAAFGNAFYVIVGPDACIEDLTKTAKEARTDDLEHVNAARLTVWRCTDPGIDFGNMDSDDFNKRLKEGFSPDEKKVKKLNPKQGVEQLADETLLFEIPASKDLRSGTPENRTFTIDEHTPRKPVKAIEDLVQKAYMSDSFGIATIPAKRPRLSDGIQSYDVYQSSGVVLWTNTKQIQSTDFLPDVDLSSFPDSYGMSFESDDLDHPTTVEAKFLDLAELPGWSSELAEVFVTKILIRKEYGELDEFPLLLPC